MAQSSSYSILVNQQEAAKLCGLRPKAFRSLERQGRGPDCIVVNRRVRRYPVTSLNLFLAARLTERLGGINGKER